jgi:hypothetical protein
MNLSLDGYIAAPRDERDCLPDLCAGVLACRAQGVNSAA